MNSTGLDDKTLQVIKDEFVKFNITQFMIYGSRAKGSFHKYSDIDICIDSDLTSFQIAIIKNEIEDKIIYFVDIVNFKNLNNENLKQSILNHNVLYSISL